MTPDSPRSAGDMLRDWGAQFRNLALRDAASWPAAPRHALMLLTASAVIGGLWWLWLLPVRDQLEAERAREPALRADYIRKLAHAANLDELKKQRAQVIQHVTQLEKQLPSKAEMDALLSDINQAGLARNLQFELFRPGLAALKDDYAELPIAIKVTGKYHDIGAFTADVANLSRIVTLNNIHVAPSTDKDKPGALVFEATAKTFRFLDADEMAAQRVAKAAKPGAKP